MSWMEETYRCLKENDIPNWIVFFVLSIFWPLMLFFWRKRKYRLINNLQISLARGIINLDGTHRPALTVTLTNHTNNTLFLTNFRIKNEATNFKIYSESTRDFITSYYPFLFLNKHNQKFEIKDIILNTGESAVTSIALEEDINDVFFNFRPNLLRRTFSIQKYFVIQYSVFMNEKRYFVKTIY